jgi:hypothetical protein
VWRCVAVGDGRLGIGWFLLAGHRAGAYHVASSSPLQNKVLRQSTVGSAIMQSIQLASLDVEGLRTRLRKMSDEELRKFGKAARYMVSQTANTGKPPLPAFALQLEEACAEWRRRHPTREVS